MALKKLKMEKEKEGFPITSLREINMLMKAKHPNIVHVRVSTCTVLVAMYMLQVPGNIKMISKGCREGTGLQSTHTRWRQPLPHNHPYINSYLCW